MREIVENPGSLSNFQGTLEDYTRAVAIYRAGRLSPEALDVEIMHVPDQALTSTTEEQT